MDLPERSVILCINLEHALKTMLGIAVYFINVTRTSNKARQGCDSRCIVLYYWDEL